MKLHRNLPGLFLASVCAPTLHAGDFALSYEISGSECTPEPTAVWLRGSLLRFDMVQAGERYSVLYDGSEQLMTMLDHRNRTRMALEMDDDRLDYQADVMTSTGTYIDKEMAKARAQMAQMCDQLKQQGQACPDLSAMMDLKAMTRMAQQQAGAAQGGAQPDPRRSAMAAGGNDMALSALAAQQGDAAPAGGGAQLGTDPRAPAGGAAPARLPGMPAPFVATTRESRINEVACTMHEQREGERLLAERCITPFESLGMDARQLAQLQRALKRMQRFADTFRGMTSRFVDTPEKQEDTKGLALRQVCYASDGKERGRADATFQHGQIDTEVFEIPSSYREQGMMQSGGEGQGAEG